jgi:hypothetical protein
MVLENQIFHQISFFLFAILLIILSYATAIQFKNIFVFDRKCIANCWFETNSKVYKWLYKDSLLINIISACIALFMVLITLMNFITLLATFYWQMLFSLGIALGLSFWIYSKKLAPSLKADASSFYIKFISAFLGSFFGILVLFGLTLATKPEFNVTLNVFENIDQSLQIYQNFFFSDFKLLVIYGNFDGYISNFTWFGMLKLSETFDQWIVIFAWIFFIFTKIGFFIAFCFIALSIKDTSIIKNIQTQTNSLFIGIFLIAVAIIGLIEYTLQEKKILNTLEEKQEIVRVIKPFEPNVQIEFKDINTSLNRLRINLVNSLSPAMFGYQSSRLNKEINGAFYQSTSEVQNSLTKAQNNINEQLKLQLITYNEAFTQQTLQDDANTKAKIKRDYQLTNSKAKIVWDYIFKE